MALSLNKPKLDNLAGDVWKSAGRLRGKFKAYEYQSVILPIRMEDWSHHRAMSKLLSNSRRRAQLSALICWITSSSTVPGISVFLRRKNFEMNLIWMPSSA